MMPDDDIGFPEPPMEQAEIDQAMWDEDRDAMVDSIATNGVSEQDEACVQAARALAGDSNDAEHDALVAMLAAFGPGQAQLGRIVETHIPEWERAAYSKLVELVNGAEIEAEDEIEYVEGCDDCMRVNGDLKRCPKCVAYSVHMYRQYIADAIGPVVDYGDPDAIPERDIDWELKAEREDSR